jgi:RNA polymerase sigma-70 factor (ECF subfamily)
MAALGQLFEELRPRLLEMLRWRMDPVLATRVDAEDILNDAFIRAQCRWREFRQQPKTTPDAWLFGMVRDTMIETWRRETRQQRDRRREMPWPEQSSIQLGLRLVSAGTTPTAAARRAELRRRVEHVMSLLGDTDREILWMRHFGQLSFKEVADVLSITPNAANVRYARALLRLKDLWHQVVPRQESSDEQ